MTDKTHGPVVVCFIDGLGASSDLACMPRFEALGDRRLKACLAAAGSAVGTPEGSLGTADVGYRAAGTGHPVTLARAAFDEAAAGFRLVATPPLDGFVATAEYEKGTMTEFFTGVEKPKCRVHLFANLSDVAPHDDHACLLKLIDAILFYEVPIVVHAFLDGRTMPRKSAWRLLESIEETLDGKGTIATLSGRAYALDTSGAWAKTHAAFQTIVLAYAGEEDGPARAASLYEALAESYDEGKTDHDLEPIRIGDYDGVTGELRCELGGSGPAEWIWRAQDVGLFVGTNGDDFAQLAAMFTRTGLSDEVAGWVTTRGRPVVAFDASSLGSLVTIPGRSGLRAMFPAAPAPASLRTAAEAAGASVVRIATPDHASLVTFALDGGAPGSSAQVERNGPTALSAARAAVDGGARLVVVGVGDVCDAMMLGTEGEIVRALGDLDGPLTDLATAVSALGGTLIVTSAHAGAERPVDAEGPRGPTEGPVPMFVVEGKPTYSLRSEGSLVDVAPTVLDLLGIASGAMAGSSMIVRGTEG